jgi:hypothetical protein
VRFAAKTKYRLSQNSRVPVTGFLFNQPFDISKGRVKISLIYFCLFPSYDIL